MANLISRLLGRKRKPLLAPVFVESVWENSDAANLRDFLRSESGKRLITWLGNSGAVRMSLACAENPESREFRAGAAAQWMQLAAGLISLSKQTDESESDDAAQEAEIEAMLARMSVTGQSEVER